VGSDLIGPGHALTNAFGAKKRSGDEEGRTRKGRGGNRRIDIYFDREKAPVVCQIISAGVEDWMWVNCFRSIVREVQQFNHLLRHL